MYVLLHVHCAYDLSHVSVKNKLAYAYAAEFPYRNNHILECEFYLLENLDCCLVVYQPYRCVTETEPRLLSGDRTSTAVW